MGSAQGRRASSPPEAGDRIVIRFAAVMTVAAIMLLMAGASAQFLPKPPRDERPDRAKLAFDAGRYGEAAEILEDYLDDEPRDGDARVQLGWAHYRTGSFTRAREAFTEALKRNPRSDDARIGLGYALLQLDGGDVAARRFREVLTGDPENRDALEGMVLAGRRASSREVVAEARAASKKLASFERGTRADLLPANSERRLRSAASSATPLNVPARASRDYLEIMRDGRWHPIFVKGFNLGLALPGKFPSEFPTDEKLYRSWFETIASLGSNSIRVYTLLPPQFYRALKNHNAAHPDQHLWLIQGVWAELPPKFDFSDPHYFAEFNAETARVIDAVHGNIVLGPRAGHAYGVYDADASESVLAYIIGREWEPFAVEEYNRIRSRVTSFHGRFFNVAAARPMECWVASVCDFAAGYEIDNYRTIHPLTFANWPTLDPLEHWTESNRAEEDRWRKHYGIPFHPLVQPWEDDAVTLDSTLIQATDSMPAGFFAAYHIYPNFPDFMNLEPEYDEGRDHEGESRYAAYLAALKAHHGDQPVLIAEFGIATSRGVGHMHPQGWHHGGLSEERQGELVGRMMRNIHDSRYAGGVVFEFVDEWFKSTWSVAPFESPSDRRRNWFNAESPEESYGFLATTPAGSKILLDGKTGDWQMYPVLMTH